MLRSPRSWYAFQPITTQEVAERLTLGEVISTELAVAGERDVYEFTLDAPANVYFDSMTNTSRLSWTLEGPGGTVVDMRDFDRTEFGSGIRGTTNARGEGVIFPLIPGDY